MFNVGDLVTRNSYNNDIVFKIIDIQGDICYLKGVSVRLFADSSKSDLVLCDDINEDDQFSPRIDEYRELDRNEYFYLPGRILHIDTEFQLTNTRANPYKIRKKAIFENCKNHQK